MSLSSQRYFSQAFFFSPKFSRRILFGCTFLQCFLLFFFCLFLLILNDYCIQYLFQFLCFFRFPSLLLYSCFPLFWRHFLFIGNIKWRQISHLECCVYSFLFRKIYIAVLLVFIISLSLATFRAKYRIVCIVNSSPLEGYLWMNRTPPATATKIRISLSLFSLALFSLCFFFLYTVKASLISLSLALPSFLRNWLPKIAR